MGRKALPKKRILDPAVREGYLKQLTPYFIQNGFHRITTNDIVQVLGVSKATLYEHFASRNEIFGMVVQYVIGLIREKKAILQDTSMPYQERYVHLVALILEQIMGMSAILLDDLEKHFPDLWEEIIGFIDEWNEDLRNFFAEGIKADEFTDINPSIMSRSVTVLLRELLSPDFLIKNDISVNEAFIDGFRLHSRGIIKGEKANDKVDELFQKVVKETMERHLKQALEARGISGGGKRE